MVRYMFDNSTWPYTYTYNVFYSRENISSLINYFYNLRISDCAPIAQIYHYWKSFESSSLTSSIVKIFLNLIGNILKNYLPIITHTCLLKYMSTADPFTVAYVKFSTGFLNWKEMFIVDKYKIHIGLYSCSPWGHWCPWGWSGACRGRGRRRGWRCTRPRWSWRSRPTPSRAPGRRSFWECPRQFLEKYFVVWGNG